MQGTVTRNRTCLSTCVNLKLFIMKNIVSKVEKAFNSELGQQIYDTVIFLLSIIGLGLFVYIINS